MVDFGLYGRLDALQERVSRLERALEVLAAASGVSLPDDLAADGATATAGTPVNPVDEEIAAALRAGDKIRAIKIANAKLKLPLREATEYVGRVEGSLGEA